MNASSPLTSGKSDPSSLAQFIREAKIAVHTHQTNLETIGNDETRWVYKRDPYVYFKKRFGENRSLEQEIVTTDDNQFVLWGMNAYTRLVEVPKKIVELSEQKFLDAAFEFVDMALHGVPEQFPFRGPVGHAYNNLRFSYVNTIEKSCSKHPLIDFQGHDDVHFTYMERFHIFRTEYHGGLILPRNR